MGRGVAAEGWYVSVAAKLAPMVWLPGSNVEMARAAPPFTSRGIGVCEAPSTVKVMLPVSAVTWARKFKVAP